MSLLLMTEKTFYKETEQYYILENLMNVAVEKSLQKFKEGNIVEQQSAIFQTSNGTYYYIVSTSDDMIYNVQLTCTTNEDKEYTATYQFDITKKEIIFWSEY